MDRESTLRTAGSQRCESRRMLCTKLFRARCALQLLQYKNCNAKTWHMLAGIHTQKIPIAPFTLLRVSLSAFTRLTPIWVGLLSSASLETIAKTFGRLPNEVRFAELHSSSSLCLCGLLSSGCLPGDFSCTAGLFLGVVRNRTLETGLLKQTCFRWICVRAAAHPV